MIIYGSRMYGKKNLVQGFGECPHCGKYGKHRSYDGRKFGHVYFIPLFPLGKPARVMKECPHCNMGSHVPQTQVGVLYQRVEALMQPCVLAASEGRRMFIAPDDGGQQYNAPFLVEAVDLLYCAGFEQEIPELVGLLDNEPARYEHSIVKGTYAQLRGDASAAFEAYRLANEAEPGEVLPYVLMSEHQMRVGQPGPALALIERACELEPDDVQLLLAQAAPLEALGRFQDLAAVIDRAIDLAPQLGQDKNFMKLRKKFVKKAEKTGR